MRIYRVVLLLAALQGFKEAKGGWEEAREARDIGDYRDFYLPPGRESPPNKYGKEESVLNTWDKPYVTHLDLDDVKPGHIWTPISVKSFGPGDDQRRILIKMCQLNYQQYAEGPHLLPMGGQLNKESKCNDLDGDHVQLVPLMNLEAMALNLPNPSGFIFHETRCGSTLVANMLATNPAYRMWAESTAPWMVAQACKNCPDSELAPVLRTVMRIMNRPSTQFQHAHTFYKLQNSEFINMYNVAFPETKWIFMYREPVEVLMSRMGAQRLGMEGMEDEVTHVVEKSAKAAELRTGLDKKASKLALILSRLCKKAIRASQMYPYQGMMVEYTQVPEAVSERIMPHFGIAVTEAEVALMMGVASTYSKVAKYASKTDDKQEELKLDRYNDDSDAKHELADPVVIKAADALLRPTYMVLQSMEQEGLPDPASSPDGGY